MTATRIDRFYIPTTKKYEDTLWNIEIKEQFVWDSLNRRLDYLDPEVARTLARQARGLDIRHEAPTGDAEDVDPSLTPQVA